MGRHVQAYSSVATRLRWSEGNRRLGNIMDSPISWGVGSLSTSARRKDSVEYLGRNSIEALVCQ